MTVTSNKRTVRLDHYALKDARRDVYRALYGYPSKPDPQGRPELNEFREFLWEGVRQRAKSVFVSLATKDGLESNGLFPPQTFAMLQRRVDALRHYKR